MQVTRREILRAIRTEKLKNGQWIEGREAEDAIVYDKECKVCAVGGVLRQAGVKCDLIDTTAYNICDLGEIDQLGDEKEELQNKRYMNALSVKFEKLAEKYGSGKRTREKLCQFVKRNFPKKIKLDTGEL